MISLKIIFHSHQRPTEAAYSQYRHQNHSSYNTEFPKGSPA